ncbi:DUF1080 domain-containing protein [Gemmata sp. JC717]|uniref:DUF1080 domain-containing protein n=1 Tax=Gemmata algarum TaxID=2975278 RepID=A0ABU5EYW4_9BACT|nr:DUF1080 domain-containing protein [Gemmata algarum]MDY3554705.1 DUF1080 domain-containing protein [Gemmata algarum]MDY3559667.1 DUF1080 domain-containing protein [Gemmata algarum]
MRLPNLSRASALVAAALFVAPAVRADDTSEFLNPDNWEGRADIWKVDAKAKSVTGETKEDPKYNTFLCSKAKYGDFELTCKVRLVNAVGNSGFQVRSERFDKEGDKQSFRVRGPQVDIGKGYFGGLYGEGVGGYLLKPKKDAAKPAEVNDYKIVVKGNHVTVTLNGEVTVDEEFPDNKGKNPAPKDGIIAFQAHAGPPMKVEFTDIKFTKLK